MLIDETGTLISGDYPPSSIIQELENAFKNFPKEDFENEMEVHLPGFRNQEYILFFRVNGESEYQIDHVLKEVYLEGRLEYLPTGKTQSTKEVRISAMVSQ